ncbi:MULTISPECIES: hypothetical protein [Streptomyces]|uniref:hypothetical protein n=1 Tax=Streptomyces TaxID=1883 RepID=UPI0018DF8D93|nr:MULTISPECIES: hypothetical protein [Streptomyces]MCZ4102249.1 hypothetical protein [Streptomyces sp. H39-C1]
MPTPARPGEHDLADLTLLDGGVQRAGQVRALPQGRRVARRTADGKAARRSRRARFRSGT